MKKIMIVIVIFIVLSLLIIGCKPSNLSDQAYKIDKQALAATDEYLNAEISRESGYNKMSEIHDRIDQLYDLDDNVYTFSLSTKISSLEFAFQVGTDFEILKDRNEIAKSLNLKAINRPAISSTTKSEKDKNDLRIELNLPQYQVKNRIELLYGRGSSADVFVEGVSKKTKVTELIRIFAQISSLEDLYEMNLYCDDGFVGSNTEDENIDWATGWGN